MHFSSMCFIPFENENVLYISYTILHHVGEYIYVQVCVSSYVW